MEEILDHAETILNERGAGGVTVSEIARRMGIRPPSFYKYFASLNALYDALFARGQARLNAYIEDSVRDVEPGLETLLAGVRAFVRWSTRELGLASLLFWRPIPDFEPSPESYAEATHLWRATRDRLREAVTTGELVEAADSEEAQRLLSVAVAGIFSQQASNEPGASFEEGRFTSLTEVVLQMFVERYRSPDTTPTQPKEP